ncbi:C-type lectin domain-containing protein [Caenorhabditis elegans]|uniref:C-type lectin domain-containing protein n=1 Tax=Caenorhabditis elegans TaxID=6239 RepID=A4F308_CAEEL|nr:C-type lectin domain-containing protein [Caenorhabditis elegans]CCD63950.2 C-type lectin domain-containing protein [Caenorhabditis elegans]|eukprot:NP_741307.2 C-type LECtin [Caenorhabditis elegans]
MLLQLLLPIALVAYASGACFDNDKEVKGACFKFVNQQLTFNDARNWCHYQNPVTSSYLAYVPDQYTSSFVAAYARTAFGTNYGNFWIGLSRNSSSSPFAWDNGSPVAYTNFDTQFGQNYIAEKIVNSKWTAFGEKDKNFFVCSYNPTFSPAIISTTQEPTTEGNSCQPVDRMTLLFAYSNDLDPQAVNNSWNWAGINLYSTFSGFAFARFDVRDEEDIAYFTDFESATSYLHSHLPDSSLGFGDNNTGSDSLVTIEKFYNSKEIPVCGAISMILSKRYPDDWNLPRTVSLVREHHGIVHAVSSVDPSGGTPSNALYNLTSKTNGMSNFGTDDGFPRLVGLISFNYGPQPIYCANPEVSGQNTIELPAIDILSSESYWVSVLTQDHGPLDAFQSFNLTWSSSEYGGNTLNSSSTQGLYGLVGLNWFPFNAETYSMKLQYNYINNINEVIQVRLYGVRAQRDWLPYCD